MNDYDTIGRFGYISDYDPERHYARVEFPDLGIVSAWLPIGVPNTLCNHDERPLDIGEHVYCLLHDNTGIILCSVYDDKNKPPKADKNIRITTFEDGTTISYDREKHILDIDIKGDLCIQTTGNITSSSKGVTKIEAESEISEQAPKINLN